MKTNEPKLFTGAELTIKDNNDVIVINPERHKYAIYLNIKIIQFCYFQNTFRFVSV